MKILLLVIYLLATGFIFAQAPYKSVTKSGITLRYRVTADRKNLDCQVMAHTTGWVAVCFRPTVAMKDGNFIMGYVKGDTTIVSDEFGIGLFEHATDVSQGGKDNIISYTGSESDGITQLNFIIPLNSGDKYDREMKIGKTYRVCLGSSPNGADNLNTKHKTAKIAHIKLVSP
jgi:hypothetical protein